jgi:hypothetical protein
MTDIRTRSVPAGVAALLLAAVAGLAPAIRAADTLEPVVPAVAVGSDFKQVSNLGPPIGDIEWISSILQQSNSIYTEGMSVPQRLTFVDVRPTPANLHFLNFSVQATTSDGGHAYDFLTSWSQAIQAGQGKGPNGEDLMDQLADPAAITGPGFGPPVTTAILQSLWNPASNPVVASGSIDDGLTSIGGGSNNVAAQIAQYEASLGDRRITVRAPAGNPVINVVVEFLGYSFIGGDDYAQYELRWTSAATTIGIELAAHLSVGEFDGIVSGYGLGFGASDINGGPYHFRLDALDASSLGSQDNQIKGSDVTIIIVGGPSCTVVGPTSACQGDTGLVYGNGLPLDPTSTYLWTLLDNTSGASFASPNGSNTITVNAGASAGSFRIQLIQTSAAGIAGCEQFVTVNAFTTATDPPDQNVCSGASVSFTTTASGTGPFTYEWTFEGFPIIGGTLPTLSLGVVNPVDEGTYCVTVTGTCGPPVQQCAELLIGVLSTSALPDQTVCAGSSVSFTTTANGTGPFNYAWTFEGSPIGGNTDTLSLGAVDETDEGEYCVTVTGACGLPDKQCATLTVNPTTTVAALPDHTACPGLDVSFTANAGGTGPLSYSWTFDGNPIGANSATLALGAVDESDEGTYCVTVTGACGPPIAQCATLTVTDGAALAPLTDVVVNEGAINVVLGPALPISGMPPFSFQWFHDGLTIPTGTAGTLVLAGPVTAADAGEYCLELTDASGCGSATACLTLTVIGGGGGTVARHPGSVGLFPVHRSGFGGGHVTAGGGAVFFTIVSVTNTNTQPTTPQGFGGATNVHYEYVNVTPNTANPFLPLACNGFDRVEYFTPADTLSVLTSCHNAVAPSGQQGYLVVSAQDPSQFDVNWSHNHLIGSEIVINGSGGMYQVAMVSVPSPLADKAPTDLGVGGAGGDGQLDFDGAEYAALPEQVYIDTFVALAESRLALLNLTGGLSARNTLKISAWNDNEFPLSATRTFACWFDEPLQVVSPLFTNSFLAQNTPDDPDELDLDCNHTGDIETAWARIDSIDVSFPFGGQIAADGVVLGAVTAGPNSLIDGGTLLWESQATQDNGSFGP